MQTSIVGSVFFLSSPSVAVVQSLDFPVTVTLTSAGGEFFFASLSDSVIVVPVVPTSFFIV